MSGQGLWQVAIYLAVLLALVKPLGVFMAKVFEGKRKFLTPALGPEPGRPSHIVTAAGLGYRLTA